MDWRQQLPWEDQIFPTLFPTSRLKELRTGSRWRTGALGKLWAAQPSGKGSTSQNSTETKPMGCAARSSSSLLAAPALKPFWDAAPDRIPGLSGAGGIGSLQELLEGAEILEKIQQEQEQDTLLV